MEPPVSDPPKPPSLRPETIAAQAGGAVDAETGAVVLPIINKAEVMEALYTPLFGDILPAEGQGNTYWMSNQPQYENHQGDAGYGAGDIAGAQAKLESVGYVLGDDGIYAHPETGRPWPAVPGLLLELWHELVAREGGDELGPLGIGLGVLPQLQPGVALLREALLELLELLRGLGIVERARACRASARNSSAKPGACASANG